MIRTAGSASQRSVSAAPAGSMRSRRGGTSSRPPRKLAILLAPSLPLAHRRLRHVLRLRFKQAERQAPFVQPCPSSCLGALGRRSEILVPLPSVGEAEREVGASGEVKAQVALGSERRRQWIMLGGAVQQVSPLVRSQVLEHAADPDAKRANGHLWTVATRIRPRQQHRLHHRRDHDTATRETGLGDLHAGRGSHQPTGVSPPADREVAVPSLDPGPGPRPATRRNDPSVNITSPPPCNAAPLP